MTEEDRFTLARKLVPAELLSRLVGITVNPDLSVSVRGAIMLDPDRFEDLRETLRSLTQEQRQALAGMHIGHCGQLSRAPKREGVYRPAMAGSR